MIYRKVSIEKMNELVDWAEENNIEWDLWNSEDVFLGSEEAELGLSQWPSLY
jgi:hypothetical protein